MRSDTCTMYNPKSGATVVVSDKYKPRWVQLGFTEVPCRVIQFGKIRKVG